MVFFCNIYVTVATERLNFELAQIVTFFFMQHAKLLDDCRRVKAVFGAEVWENAIGVTFPGAGLANR